MGCCGLESDIQGSAKVDIYCREQNGKISETNKESFLANGHRYFEIQASGGNGKESDSRWSTQDEEGSLKENRP